MRSQRTDPVLLRSRARGCGSAYHLRLIPSHCGALASTLRYCHPHAGQGSFSGVGGVAAPVLCQSEGDAGLDCSCTPCSANRLVWGLFVSVSWNRPPVETPSTIHGYSSQIISHRMEATTILGFVPSSPDRIWPIRILCPSFSFLFLFLRLSVLCH